MEKIGTPQNTYYPPQAVMKQSAPGGNPVSPAGDTVDLEAAGGVLLRNRKARQHGEFDNGVPVVEKTWEITFDHISPVCDRSSFFLAPVVTGNGTVVVARGKELTGYDGKKGEAAWRLECDATICTRPLISDKGTIYVASKDGRLYAIDGDTGEKKWSKKWNQLIKSVKDFFVDSFHYDGGVEDFRKRAAFPALSIGPDGTIYGSCEHRVFAFSEKGSRKFNRLRGESVHSSPAAGSSGLVYVVISRPNQWGQMTHFLTGMDGQTGDEVWSRDLLTRSNNPVITVDKEGSILLGDKYGLQCCRGDNGEPWYSYRSENKVPPRIGEDGTHYVVGEGGKSLIVRQKNEKWAAYFKDGVAAAPVEGPYGTLIAVGRDGSGQVLAKKDGEVLAEFTCNRGAHGALEISKDGTLIVSDDRGISAYILETIK